MYESKDFVTDQIISNINFCTFVGKLNLMIKSEWGASVKFLFELSAVQ